MLKKLVLFLLCGALLASFSPLLEQSKAAPSNNKGQSAKNNDFKKKDQTKQHKDKSSKNNNPKQKDYDRDLPDTEDLIKAGITAALARSLAQDSGLTGYSSLPPGIAKNLARGKPLPPGIAKKAVPAGMWQMGIC